MIHSREGLGGSGKCASKYRGGGGGGEGAQGGGEGGGRGTRRWGGCMVVDIESNGMRSTRTGAQGELVMGGRRSTRRGRMGRE